MTDSRSPSYTFLPFARQGLGGQVQEADQAAVAGHPCVDPVDAEDQRRHARRRRRARSSVPRNVQLYGPGDIIGIDAAAIVRSEPRHWVTNFETNYLPFVEFYEEDFPWRYTPSTSSAAGRRMRPWLTLLVLAEDEFADRATPSNGPLPVIEVLNTAALPDVRDALGLGARARERRRSAGTRRTTMSNATRLAARRRRRPRQRPTRGSSARASCGRTPPTTRSSSRRSSPAGWRA